MFNLKIAASFSYDVADVANVTVASITIGEFTSESFELAATGATAAELETDLSEKLTAAGFTAVEVSGSTEATKREVQALFTAAFPVVPNIKPVSISGTGGGFAFDAGNSGVLEFDSPTGWAIQQLSQGTKA